MNTDTTRTRIEPETPPAEIELPRSLGEAVATFFDTDTVRTGADWLSAIQTGLRPTDERFGIDDLCTVAESRHVLTTPDDERAYQCVFDAMIVPFATAEPGTVRSECPTTGEEVVVDIHHDGVHASPETAFFSLGIADDAVETAGEPPFSPAETYGSFCPYVNAFATKDAYNRWDESVDAITAAVPLEYGVAIVGEMGRRLVGNERAE